jgi:O-antigen biosynthesis protein WbqP
MSIVGPRPALFNQDDLIALRREWGVDRLRPGITGWAQVNGRDQLPIPVKVAFDREYLDRQSLLFDVRIMFRTAGKLLGDKTVMH